MRALLGILLLQQLVAMLAQAAFNLPDGIENILGFKPTTGFQCERDGYFGDIDNDCRIFHLCQKQVHTGGRVEWRHWTYACGNQTMFNQLTLTCAFVDEAIPCKHATQFQYLNEVIHKSREPFLTDADVTSGISYYSNRIMSDGARARAFEDAQLMAQLVQPHASKPLPTDHSPQATVATEQPQVLHPEVRQDVDQQPPRASERQVLLPQVPTTTVATTTFQPVFSTNPVRFVNAPDLNTFNFAISTDHKLPSGAAQVVVGSFAPSPPSVTTTTATSQPIETIAPQRAPTQALQSTQPRVVVVQVRRHQQALQRTATPATPAADGQRTTLASIQPVSVRDIQSLSRRVRGNNGQSSTPLARRPSDKQPALVMRRASNNQHQHDQQQQQHHHRQVRAQAEERHFVDRAFWRAPFDIQIPNPRFESLLTRRRV